MIVFPNKNKGYQKEFKENSSSKKDFQRLKTKYPLDKKLNKIIWNGQDCSLSFHIGVDDLRTANLKFNIWKKNKENKKNVQKHFLIAESFIFLSKIIHNIKSLNQN